MGGQLTVSMKATLGLILSFMIFFVVASAVDLLVGPWDVDIVLSLAFFLPVLTVLFVFAWKAKPWAYLGTVLVGGFVVVGSTFGGPIRWETMLATVLSLLMVLEAFKAYVELKGIPK